jgi:beta-galactosidase
LLWEASLNESDMPEDFINKAHAAAREELPAQNAFTSGWVDKAYDVFIPARQHAKPPGYWKDYATPRPVLIAEYGDWEYYAQNAGFNQTAFEDLKESERNSRQLRGDGEKRLLQQAFNFQEAHNSNLRGQSFGDANWLMFDYNRGYAPDLEASGIMDIFRLPKFSFYFYKSQVKPGLDNKAGKPGSDSFLKIASYWTAKSPTEVTVFSNCDEVALYVNDSLIARKGVLRNGFNDRLNSPPFVFDAGSFKAGKLVAQGFLSGQLVATDTVLTPLLPASIRLHADISGRTINPAAKDQVFVYASVVDEHGTLVPDATNEVMFTVIGENVRIIGTNPMRAEAGIATVLLETGSFTGEISVSAKAARLRGGSLVLKPEPIR